MLLDIYLKLITFVPVLVPQLYILCCRHQLALFVGLEDCTSAGEGNLCFKKGDVMYIINTERAEIWFALHKDTGQSGYIRRVCIREKLEGMRYDDCREILECMVDYY